MDHAAQRPLGLHGPDGARVALGAVPEVTQQVRQARLVPGDVLPPGVEVVLVPVGDHDPGEVRQDPGVGHRLQAPGAEPECRILPGERAVHVFLLTGRAGAQRGLVEPGDRAAVIRARISATTLAARDAAVARQEWMNPSETTAPVTSAIS
jgi:hypothetical protein